MDKLELFYQPIISLDAKWQNLEFPEFKLTEQFNKLWNTMICDGEIFLKNSDVRSNKSGIISKKGMTGKFYCGRKILNCKCCNGTCGPNNGCNCGDCAELDNSLIELSTFNMFPKSSKIFASWDWSASDISQIKNSLESCFYEQNMRLRKNILSLNYYSSFLKQSIVFDRYMQALCRKKLLVPKIVNKFDKHFSLKERYEKTDLSPANNLGRVGSNALLTFLFSFLTRSWRSVQDADLCGDLLRSTLEAMSSLPLASLSDSSQLSSIWINIIDKLELFLRTIVDSDNASSLRNVDIPLTDKQMAVALLLELSFQKGKLSQVLSTVLFLLGLSIGSTKSEMNKSKDLLTVPLGSILKRLEEMLEDTKATVNNKEATQLSATQCYINSFNIPVLSSEISFSCSLHTSSALILSYLERIAHFKLLYNSDTLNKNYCQELYTWTLSKFSQSKSLIRNMEDIGFIKQMLPFHTHFLILTKTGIVYLLKLDPLGHDDLRPISFNGKFVVKIASCIEAMHMLALTEDGIVYSYGKAFHGQLGIQDITELKEPGRIEFLSREFIVSISCSRIMSAMLTKDGKLYMCGQMKQVQELDLANCIVEVNYKIVDVVCGLSGCSPFFY